MVPRGRGERRNLWGTAAVSASGAVCGNVVRGCMGSPRLDAFVVAMKLRSLRQARDRLAAAYDAIEARTAAATDPRASLRALAEGLAELRVGERRVHPEVGGLELVWGAGEPDLVERWLGRLRTTLQQGRARADVIPLFGGVIGEWARPEKARHEPAPADVAVALAGWTRPPGPTPPLIALIEPRLDPVRLAEARAVMRLRSARPFAPGEPPPVVVPKDDLLTEEARSDAEQLREGAIAESEGEPSAESREFYAAMRLAWEQLDTWDWPAEGAPLAPVWTRNRFRLRPRLDCVTACMVESIGDALAGAIEAVSGRARLQRRERLARLRELDAPDVIVQNEERLLAETADPFGWGPDELGAPATVRRLRLAARQLTPDAGYDYEGVEIGRAFAWAEAERALAEARGEARYVLKTDVADFYPSVSHELVRELLVWLDADPRVIDLALRVLSVRLPDGTRTTRGLPLGLALSRAVGDLLIAIAVAEMRAAADVEVVTMIDDIVCVARTPDDLQRAWSALERTLGAMGLSTRADKTGSLALGAPPPTGVPLGPFRWGLLRLEADGFHLDEDTLATFIELTVQRIDAHEAVFDRLVTFREQLRYVWAWLAPAARLGPSHLDAVGEALRRFVDGVDMAGRLRHDLSTRFLGGAPLRTPDAWLHWPVTAGGLSLPYPAADLFPLRLALEREPPPTAPPAGTAANPDDDSTWGAWYAERLKPLEPAEPAETEATTDLVKRFIERGTKLGQKGGALSPYWRWVLRALGPDVLDAYGSFDFLPTDLVPVRLIRRAIVGEGR